MVRHTDGSGPGGASPRQEGIPGLGDLSAVSTDAIQTGRQLSICLGHARQCRAGLANEVEEAGPRGRPCARPWESETRASGGESDGVWVPRLCSSTPVTVKTRRHG